ncbi:MAG: alpha/beta hydrolase [Candidatus Zixiibacteriota bacterium]
MKILSIIGIIIILGILVVCQGTDKGNLKTESILSIIDTVYSPDSVLIEYEVSGAGNKALVFIHCWCCDRGYFENQIKFLSPNYKIVAIDLAGHGASGLNRDEWTVSAYAQDVATVVNKLGLKDIVLIGHSMGAMVILEAADLLSGKVRGVIGIDNYQDFNHDLPPDQIEQYLTYLNTDFKNNTKIFVKQIFNAQSDSALIERISEDMSMSPESVGIESFNNLLHFDYKKALSRLNIPVRGIHGDMNPTNTEANKEIYNDFEVVIIPGTGHFPHLEKPELFNQELKKILNEFWNMK